MTLDELLTYCNTKPGCEETFPFDEHTLVLKVMGKMWAATNLTEPVLRVNLKCNPERAEELREYHEEIVPGYHMNKKHWNTVILGEGTLERSLIHELIDHSYALVVKSLTKAKKAELAEIAKNEQ